MKALSSYRLFLVRFFLLAALLAAIGLLSTCATNGESFQDKAKHYSEAASLKPISFSKKNELRFWRMGWVVSGRVVNENAISFYGQYDNKTDRFLYLEKLSVLAPKDFASDLQKLSSLNGAHISCESEINDWPVYAVEGNWQGKSFTFFADIDMCTSENLKILQKYSGYQEMLQEMKKK